MSKGTATTITSSDLRHAYCLNLILAGADLKTVKEMIGHKDISMTDRYTHLTQGYRNAVQEKLAQHYAASNPRGT